MRTSYATARVQLVDLDRSPQVPAIEAQYNPKEIQVDKGTSWTSTAAGKGNHPELTFTSSNARTLCMELLFDTCGRPCERGCKGKCERECVCERDVHAIYVARLVGLMDVMDPDGEEDKRRPPKVALVWGDALPPFIGVLESVTTKYTMFLSTGTPVRATCSVKLIEGSRMSWKRGGR